MDIKVTNKKQSVNSLHGVKVNEWIVGVTNKKLSMNSLHRVKVNEWIVEVTSVRNERDCKDDRSGKWWATNLSALKRRDERKPFHSFFFAFLFFSFCSFFSSLFISLFIFLFISLSFSRCVSRFNETEKSFLLLPFSRESESSDLFQTLFMATAL